MRDLRNLLDRFRPARELPQIPTGWWQDAKRVAQPPGSFLDSSLRLNRDGSPAVHASTKRSMRIKRRNTDLPS